MRGSCLVVLVLPGEVRMILLAKMALVKVRNRFINFVHVVQLKTVDLAVASESHLGAELLSFMVEQQATNTVHLPVSEVVHFRRPHVFLCLHHG